MKFVFVTLKTSSIKFESSLFILFLRECMIVHRAKAKCMFLKLCCAVIVMFVNSVKEMHLSKKEK